MKKIVSLLIAFVLAVSLIVNITSCKSDGDVCVHEWSEPSVQIAATCGRSGVSSVVCLICGTQDRIIVDALPHSFYDSWKYDETYHWKEASCEHKYVDGYKGVHKIVDGACEVCGAQNASMGLEYKGNLGEDTYRVIGIGTTLDADVIVPSYYKDKKIVGVDDNAFADCPGLKSVRLQAYITSIGDRAFANSEDLMYVQFTSAVKHLGSEAFANCTGLQQIIFYGTQEEWYALEKGNDWDKNTGKYTVYCINSETNDYITIPKA